MFLTIGQVIIGRGLGDSVAVGYAMTFYSVASLLAGVVFGVLAKRMKNTMLCFCPPFGIAISAFGIYLSQTYAMVCVFLAIGGFTSTCILPRAITHITSMCRPSARSWLPA